MAEFDGAPVSGGEGTVGTWEQAVQWLRSQPDQQDLVHAAYYDDPLLSAADRYWRSEEWCAVREFLPPGKGTALDAGAGRGISSFALAKDGFGVTALEPDPSAIVGAEAIRSLAREAGLPIGVQLVAASHREDILLRTAGELEASLRWPATPVLPRQPAT